MEQVARRHRLPSDRFLAQQGPHSNHLGLKEQAVPVELEVQLVQPVVAVQQAEQQEA